MRFGILDTTAFIGYCFIVIGLGLWLSREKKGEKKDAKDYFLASKSLPWWAVGASLIASNISAEQFIGMSGSGFAIGMGIASYEFMAAITLVIVAAFFLPIYLDRGIYTMPQFLEMRFDKRVKNVMAIFWLLVFVFVNLTSILYMGALAIENMMGIDFMWGVVGLSLFALVYSVYGGLKAVAWTDVIQVIFLIGGGFITTYVAFKLLGDGSVSAGIAELSARAPEKFDLILDKADPNYKSLPGLGVLLGGMWVANLYYWGCNQYIIQRALAAKSTNQAQMGLIFAGFLKMLLPLIVVIPGIIAFVMTQDGVMSIDKPDNAYPALLNLIPSGLRGVAFAALVAAIVSSLASMMNSISSIFTMDIYCPYFDKNASETKKVNIGRVTSVVALTIAGSVAPVLTNLDQAFQYIQEFTGFVSPGALAIFLAGFFYKKATSNGALAAALGTFIFSVFFKVVFPEMPFMDRMGYVFLMCCALIWVFAMFQNNTSEHVDTKYSEGIFKTSGAFKLGTVAIIIILTYIYYIWW